MGKAPVLTIAVDLCVRATLSSSSAAEGGVPRVTKSGFFMNALIRGEPAPDIFHKGSYSVAKSSETCSETLAKRDCQC